jgi:hypothetical protein
MILAAHTYLAGLAVAFIVAAAFRAYIGTLRRR